MQRTVKLYIRPDKDAEKGFIYYLDDSEYTNHWPRDSDIHICDVEAMFVVPADLKEDELRQRAIKTMRDKQAAIRAAAHKEVEELDKKIQRLLLLTHIVATVEEEVTEAGGADV